jgi:hypothetical protein
LLLVVRRAGSEQNASECGKSGKKTKVHDGVGEQMLGNGKCRKSEVMRRAG